MVMYIDRASHFVVVVLVQITCAKDQSGGG